MKYSKIYDFIKLLPFLFLSGVVFFALFCNGNNPFEPDQESSVSSEVHFQDSNKDSIHVSVTNGFGYAITNVKIKLTISFENNFGEASSTIYFAYMIDALSTRTAVFKRKNIQGFYSHIPENIRIDLFYL